MLVFSGFVRGYAAANRQPPEVAMKELLERCRHNPDEQFVEQASAVGNMGHK
jgi:hypothetical protein